MNEITIHIEGQTRLVALYNLSSLDTESFRTEEYDLSDHGDLLRFVEEVNALAEEGELDALEDVRVVLALDPEGIEELTLHRGTPQEAGEPLDSESFVLDNLSPYAPFEMVQRAEVGDLFYLRSESGRGIWDLAGEVPEEPEGPMEIGYYDCTEDLDIYDALRESYYDFVCDTMVPERLKVAGTPLSLDRFDFEPAQISGALYRVVEDPENGLKSLERLPVPPRLFLDESEEEF
ncbi:hypothetical protein [Nitratifractor sp.]